MAVAVATDVNVVANSNAVNAVANSNAVNVVVSKAGKQVANNPLSSVATALG